MFYTLIISKLLLLNYYFSIDIKWIIKHLIDFFILFIFRRSHYSIHTILLCYLLNYFV